MRSLVLLCKDPAIPTRQREKFCEDVVEALSRDSAPKQIALEVLRALWVSYDSGGISAGRSLRATLLEKIIHCIDDDENLSLMQNFFSILLGMYHDPVFINAGKWFDYSIEHFYETNLFHRTWLATAAFALEIDDVEDMADWPIERIAALLKN